MRRLRYLSLAILLSLTALSMLGFVLVVRVVGDGLNRYPTIAKLQNARAAWDKGQGWEAAGDLTQASWMAVDGGVRWQVAHYYIDRAVRYKHQQQMTDAAKACADANTVLGQYDNGWEMDYYCDWMVWDLDAP